MKTKIWEKEKINTPVWLEKFTAGNDNIIDLELAKYDVIGSIAHAEMLYKTNFINKKEFFLLKKELQAILNLINSGKFKISENVEDIHSQIEILLIQKLGDTGKKIHTARSRNDQVLLDIKLYSRYKLKELIKQISALFNLLIELAEKNKNTLMPGYTHLQAAMPSSFGLWFSAYAESLEDDMELIIAAYNTANKNPLGSGAGYGSSLPINRTITTQLLEFESMNYNVVYAQMTRGKTEKITLNAIASVAATLSKMAMDICLYNSQNFKFLSLPDYLTTGSSIMPHKKNPDVFELIRAKCNRLQALPNEITLLTNNLPSGYHRDFQLTKEILFPAFKEIISCVEASVKMLKEIKINKNIVDNEKYKFIFSVESVNELVKKGKSFREAYKITGDVINKNKFIPLKNISHTHEGSIGNLCLKEISGKFNRQLKRVK